MLTAESAHTDVVTRERPAEMSAVYSLPRAVGRATRAHRLIARALLGGLGLQIFFAGLGIFGISSFLPHAILGPVVVLSSFALPIVAWRGHLDTALVRRSWLLVGLMLFQGLLIDAGRFVHVIAAFHPVNAMLLVLVTYSLAFRDLSTADARAV